MPQCVICGGKEFYAEAGFYFCQECQTQTQDLREEFLEDRLDLVTRVRKVRIRSNRSNKSEEPLGWTTWEQYNFILLGMINEFVELGASLDIKMTILQLWTAYLRKLEVAFTSMTRKKVPKLAKTYNKRDAEIIYGKAVRMKKKQKQGTSGYTSGSSVTSGLQSDNSSSKNIHTHKRRLIAAEYERYVQSHESSEGGAASVMNQSLFSMQSSTGQSSKNSSIRIRFNKAAKKESQRIKQLSAKLPRESRAKFHQTYKRSAYCDGPQVMTPIQLWALIYLAMRIHDENIQLADMLRWAREGHVSYYRLDHLLPPEVTLTGKEVNMLYQRAEIKHKGLRRSIGNMARFLDVWETKTPDLLSLIERYCTELQLPKGIAIYAERMMALSPPRMQFNAKTAWFPNYEGRAMAIIVVVLKMLFALDGVTEYEISRVVEKINRAATARGLDRSKLFSFCEWQRYVECRRNLLVNVHFPTKLKRDPNSTGNSHLFLNYFAAMKAKSNHREEPAVSSPYHVMPQNLTDALKNVIEKLGENVAPAQKDVEIFPPSLTPQHSYLQQMLQNPDKDLPSVLRADFTATKIGYMTKPKTLEVLAAHCNINLRIVDTGLHFLEKVVPPYLQPKLPNVKEYNEKTQIERPIVTESESHPAREACDDLEEYLHRKAPFILNIDPGKRDEYEQVFRASEKRRCNATNNSLDFCFDEVFPDGKLLVRNDDDSDDEDTKNSPSTKGIADDFESAGDKQVDQIIDSLDKWNVTMSRYEKRRLVTTLKGESTWPRLYKPNPPTVRDPQTGKFVSLETSTKCKVAKRISTRNRKKKLRSQKNDASSETAIFSKEDGNLDADQANDEDEIYVDNEFGLNDNDLSILHETSFNSSEEYLRENNFPCSENETETLFRPYSEYWLLRCVFSQTHQANFRDVLKFLPYNFTWLLEECSSIVEMSEEDLYEEICLVESYYSDILKPEKDPPTGNNYKCKEYRTSTHCFHARKKW